MPNTPERFPHDPERPGRANLPGSAASGDQERVSYLLRRTPPPIPDFVWDSRPAAAFATYPPPPYDAPSPGHGPHPRLPRRWDPPPYPEVEPWPALAPYEAIADLPTNLSISRMRFLLPPPYYADSRRTVVADAGAVAGLPIAAASAPIPVPGPRTVYGDQRQAPAGMPQGLAAGRDGRVHQPATLAGRSPPSDDGSASGSLDEIIEEVFPLSL